MPARRALKKRSKTYTGCWTCRDRSVKCGEEKPKCLRCGQSGIHCKGYGIGLVWPEENGSKIRRRNILLESFDRRAILSDSDLDVLLAQIDNFDGADHLLLDLFAVFPTRRDDGTKRAAATDVLPDNAVTLRHRDENVVGPATELHLLDIPLGTEVMPSREWQTPDKTVEFTGSRNLTALTIPASIDPLNITTERERLLMHLWSTFLSGIMTPFPRPDNAFRDVITLIALSALTTNQNSEGHLALLHALYTLTAAARRHVSGPEIRLNRASCHQQMAKSVRHLGNALTSTVVEEQQAILATISILTIVHAFAGGSAVWRTHLNGGLLWLHSIDLSTWMHSRSGMLVYQLFYTLAAFRPMQPRLAKGLGPMKCGLPGADVLDSLGQHSSSAEGSWHFDTVLGITEGVMDNIETINNWLYASTKPTAIQLQELELRIYRSDPSYTQIKAPNKLCEQMARAHSMAFYYGCHIYFSTALLQAPPSQLQHFVRHGVECLEEIITLERGLHVSGILWPAFIIACETEGSVLRSRVIKYFDWRSRFSLANTADAMRVVTEVWRRRDEDQSGKQVFWNEVMSDLDIDIILS